MGYDLHVTRRNDWFDDGPDITLSEWVQYLEVAPDMRLDGYAEAVLSHGEPLRLEASGVAVWTGYAKDGLNGNHAWFVHVNGEIVVKNPDIEIRRKMFEVAVHFGARVQGDDGEFYDKNGILESKENIEGEDSSIVKPHA